MTQLRIAETEKYPHVTFFFNGGEETQFPGEDRIMVPSPKVATYDLQPEMSAPEVCEKLVAAIDSGKYDLVVVNFANPDMVGHTGILAAAIKACETVDTCLGKVEAAVRRQGGAMLVTADHGNAELMRDPTTGGPHTAHTLNKVPVILVNEPEPRRSAARRQAGRCGADPAAADGAGAAGADDRAQPHRRRLTDTIRRHGDAKPQIWTSGNLIPPKPGRYHRRASTLASRPSGSGNGRSAD